MSFVWKNRLFELNPMYCHEEITGVFDWENHVFQDDDPEQRTIIGTLEDGTTIKGRAARGALECGLTYRFLGHWTTHPTYGKQFAFTSFSLASPSGERATVKYLAKGPSIGRARAQQIWNLYGEKSLEVARTDPGRVAIEISGLTPERAESVAEYFRQHERREKLTIEVEGMLGGRGFPRSLPEKVIREWGEQAPQMIRERPYLLMRFPGIGFARADTLYLELGHDPAAIERQGYCLWHAITSDGNGHTWYSWTIATQALTRSISHDHMNAEAAFDWASRQGLLVARTDAKGGRWFAETGKAVAEVRVAEYVYQAERESLVMSMQWPELR